MYSSPFVFSCEDEQKQPAVDWQSKRSSGMLFVPIVRKRRATAPLRDIDRSHFVTIDSFFWAQCSVRGMRPAPHSYFPKRHTEACGTCLRRADRAFRRLRPGVSPCAAAGATRICTRDAPPISNYFGAFSTLIEIASV
jgi:hypothetical protein